MTIFQELPTRVGDISRVYGCCAKGESWHCRATHKESVITARPMGRRPCCLSLLGFSTTRKCRLVFCSEAPLRRLFTTFCLWIKIIPSHRFSLSPSFHHMEREISWNHFESKRRPPIAERVSWWRFFFLLCLWIIQEQSVEIFTSHSNRHEKCVSFRFQFSPTSL